MAVAWGCAVGVPIMMARAIEYGLLCPARTATHSPNQSLHILMHTRVATHTLIRPHVLNRDRVHCGIITRMHAHPRRLYMLAQRLRPLNNDGYTVCLRRVVIPGRTTSVPGQQQGQTHTATIRAVALRRLHLASRQDHLHRLRLTHRGEVVVVTVVVVVVVTRRIVTPATRLPHFYLLANRCSHDWTRQLTAVTMPTRTPP